MPPHDIVNLGISQAPEGRRIFSRLTVEDNLRLGASVKRKGKNFDKDSKDVYDLKTVVKHLGILSKFHLFFVYRCT